MSRNPRIDNRRSLHIISWSSSRACLSTSVLIIALPVISWHLPPICKRGALSKNIGRVLTHQYILDKVWVNSIESDLSSLRVYVTSLRKKIEKISNEKYIQTHVGVGYKMIKIDNSDVEDKNNE